MGSDRMRFHSQGQVLLLFYLGTHHNCVYILFSLLRFHCSNQHFPKSDIMYLCRTTLHRPCLVNKRKKESWLYYRNRMHKLWIVEAPLLIISQVSVVLE